MDHLSLRKESRYGLPAADQIVFNRHYILGYSYYFRQAKWALEIVNSGESDIERPDNFRPDYRIPENFRADLADYTHSGYDRGHLVASANQRESEIQNSETFLLSNMSPQKPGLNRKTWKELEQAIRELDQKPKILETYVVCGPVFYFDRAVEQIGSSDPNGVSIPVPHAYFKSVLSEDDRGKLHMWSFVLPNEENEQELSAFQVSTALVEKLAGIKLWQQLVGTKINTEKNRIRRIW